MFEIIVTIDKAKSIEQIKALSRLGATIFRLNGSFLSQRSIVNIATAIRQGLAEEDHKGKILLDLPGYKIRFTNLCRDHKFARNQVIILWEEWFNHPNFMDHLKPGMTLRVNDGTVELVCDKIHDAYFTCITKSEGTIKKGKGLHIDDLKYANCIVTPLDHNLIKIAIKNKIDYLGLSFIRNDADVLRIRNLLKGTTVECIPKIEAKESVKFDNLQNILRNTDTVIIDRGDLASEIGLEKVWGMQKDIIIYARARNIKVIVATQILPSMITHPIPSIAEIDSLYSLLDAGISGVQLSDEIVLGKYPEQVLKVVTKAVREMRGDYQPF